MTTVKSSTRAGTVWQQVQNQNPGASSSKIHNIVDQKLKAAGKTWSDATHMTQAQINQVVDGTAKKGGKSAPAAKPSAAPKASDAPKAAAAPQAATPKTDPVPSSRATFFSANADNSGEVGNFLNWLARGYDSQTSGGTSWDTMLGNLYSNAGDVPVAPGAGSNAFLEGKWNAYANNPGQLTNIGGSYANNLFYHMPGLYAGM